jgi:hypothetical protein
MVGVRFDLPFNSYLFTNIQDPSFRIVPAPPSKSVSVKDTAGSLGLHDALQYGQRSLAAEIKTDDGLRERLESVCYRNILA